MSLYLGTRKPIDYSYVILYKITCLANNKVYIGQTTDSLKRRINAHFCKNSGCKKLKNAIQKYGKESFVIEKIDHAHSQEEANAKEKAYISLYNSTDDKCGYNISKGGKTPSDVVCRPVICIETNKKYKSVREAAREFNSYESVLSSVCSGKKKTFKGKHWAFLDKDGKPILDNIDLTTKPRKTRIRCIETGEVFNSIKEASVSKKCNVCQLGQALKVNRRCTTAGGFHWEYVDKENPQKKPISKNRKKIKIICVETGKIFDSILQCAKDLGIYRSEIYQSLERGFSCKGFHFDFIEKEN